MKEKICIITTVHRLNDVRIYWKQARFLAEQGYRITILCPDYMSSDPDAIVYRAIQLPKERVGRVLVASHVVLPQALQEEADLYHLHDPELLPLALALKKRGKRVIYDAHEDISLQLQSKTWIPSFLRPGGGLVINQYLQHVAKRVDAVVGATPEIAAQFTSGVPFCNFPSRVDLPEEEYRRFPSYETRPEHLAYVGALTENRGVFSMIEAARLSGTRLQLAGGWEDQELIVQAHRMPGWPYVDWRGVLSHTDIYTLLSRCKVGLLLLAPTAAYRHSYPIKLFEYLLAGLPIVASDFSQWRKLIGSSALYVAPNRPEEAAKAIRWLLVHPKEAKAMGEAGRTLVLSKYSLEREQERLLKLYQSILQGGKRM